MDQEFPSRYFKSAEHAYASGSFLGLLMQHGIAAKPIMVDSDYTDKIEIVDTGLEPGWKVYVTVEQPILTGVDF